MRRISSAIVPVAAFLVACQSAPKPGLTDADRAAIGRLREAVSKTAVSGDAAATAALYTENGIELPPNAPAARGRTAIQTAAAARGKLSSFTLTPQDTWGVGDFAYERGTYNLTATMEGMPAYNEVGKYLVLLQKQTDGSWKMSTAMWSPDAPPPPMPPTTS
jgi:ketosteroid isomerase-like protein